MSLSAGLHVAGMGNANSTNGGIMAVETKLDTFTEAYITAALWAETDDDGTPLDSGDYELAEETRQRMIADCAKFQAENPVIFTDEYPGTLEQAGHDFWLTRNRHGAGFWDRGHGTIGEVLTNAAKSFGQCDLYIGDDGLIYS